MLARIYVSKQFPIPDAETKTKLEAIEDVIGHDFGGFTHIPNVRGTWFDFGGDGARHTDITDIYEIAILTAVYLWDDATVFRGRVREYAEELRKAHGQKSVMVVFLGAEIEFIEEKEKVNAKV